MGEGALNSPESGRQSLANEYNLVGRGGWTGGGQGVDRGGEHP